MLWRSLCSSISHLFACLEYSPPPCHLTSPYGHKQTSKLSAGFTSLCAQSTPPHCLTSSYGHKETSKLFTSFTSLCAWDIPPLILHLASCGHKQTLKLCAHFTSSRAWGYLCHVQNCSMKLGPQGHLGCCPQKQHSLHTHMQPPSLPSEVSSIFEVPCLSRRLVMFWMLVQMVLVMFWENVQAKEMVEFSFGPSSSISYCMVTSRHQSYTLVSPLHMPVLRIMVFILLNFYFITMVLDSSHDFLSCNSWWCYSYYASYLSSYSSLIRASYAIG